MNDSFAECQDNNPGGVCVVLKPCCTNRCIAKFSIMEIEDAQKSGEDLADNKRGNTYWTPSENAVQGK